MLYSPRSGTNSICDYFLKQKSTYTYFNQPWSLYQEGGVLKKAKYNECLQYDEVLTKSEITSFKRLKISNEKMLSDFDRVLLMSRRNKKEQAISYLIAESNKNFLSKDKRKYFIDSITDHQIESAKSYLDNADNILNELKDAGCKIFYYEDLYYGGFEEIFEFLNLKYIKSDFDNILDKGNRYFSGEWESKKIKSII